jgi:hypothetical protein
MGAWRFLPLLSVAAALSPAGATVTFGQTTVYTAFQIFGAGNPPIQYGPGNGATTSFTTTQIASVADFAWGNSFENAGGHSGAAAQFTTPGQAQFITHPSVAAGAVSNQPGLSASMVARVTYDFSVDTASTINLSFFGAAPNLDGSSGLTFLARTGVAGATYFLNNYSISGVGAFDFDLPVGRYSLTLESDALTGLFGNITPPQIVSADKEAFLTLTISSPTAPVSGVPEPATWAMMIVGFGAIGAGARMRQRGPAAV